MKYLVLALIVLLALVVSAPAYAQCPWSPGMPAKWVQMPDVSTTGIDIRVDSQDGEPRILADDFPVVDTGKITDVHFWGSWKSDLGAVIDVLTISFYSDVPDPDGAGPGFSRPGDLLWQRIFAPGQFSVLLYAILPPGQYEWFWDPNLGVIVQNGDRKVYQYDVCIAPAVAWTPPAPGIYWLAIQAHHSMTGRQFGWKTREPIDGHFMDDAVWGFREDSFAIWAEDLHYPSEPFQHPLSPDSLDMAFVITGESQQQQQLDWGDAPDPTYPTYSGSSGANHTIVAGMYLGLSIDAEANGQPNATATGDDLASADDEDGIYFTSTLWTSAAATVDVRASVDGQLDAWIDFNADGDWADSGEQIFIGQPLAASVNSLSFTVPASAVPGTTYARFRYSSNGGLSYTGPATDGEVEDYQVNIVSGRDWGDAPDPTYPTYSSSSGANHTIVAGMFLGSLIDAEDNGQPNATATGDDVAGVDDEDGVVFTSTLAAGAPATITVTASVAGQLDAWIDFNKDGDWNEANENIFGGSQGVAAGANSLTFTTPTTAVVGTTYARFRYSTAGGLSYTGSAVNGEVEDYQVDIVAGRDWGDAPDVYPTVSGSNGARHMIVTGFHLGAFIDAELDGQPNATATGDDINPPTADDEDGVTFMTPLQVGQNAQINVIAALPGTMPGLLDAWIDFNGNGNWTDPGEQIFASVPLVNGNNNLNFVVPASALAGNTFARFRLTDTGGQPPDGFAPNGEVEDYEVVIVPYGVTAGITIDVHQDCDVTDLPNDFHIEGKILSHFSPPILTSHIDGPFAPPAGTFSYTISAVPDPSGYYTFTADWTLTNGSTIPYCTVIHLGLVFAEVGNNTVGSLIGWWTHDGVKIGDLVPVGTFVNNGYVPLTGFNVTEDPAGLGQSIRISAGRNPNPQQIPIEIVAMDLVSLARPPRAADLAPVIAQLREGGGQDWQWKHVVDSNGLQVSPTNPIHLGYGTADSFFDVFFDVEMSPGQMLPGQYGVPHGQQFQTPPGGLLASRIQFQFTNNEGESELRWEWNIHERPLEQLSFLQDFGDAPDTYKTLLASNGPWHVIIPGFHLGQLEDAELNGQPNAMATGDDINPPTTDDEDGVTFITPLQVGQLAQIGVVAAIPTGTNGKLDAWVDFNCNGMWDPGEQIIASLPLVNGNNIISFMVPTFAVAGNSCARFRLSTIGGLSFEGLADTGEVEDYRIDIVAAQNHKWQQLPDLTTNGIDIKATKDLILADDFRCCNRTKITDITVWASWLNDILPNNDPSMVSFTLSIHADIPDPDGDGPQYSRPGALLWAKNFAPAGFTVTPYATGVTEGWWDPSIPTSYLPVGDHVCWRYDFDIPASDAFCQEGSVANPKIYWLDVQATPVGTSAALFGWKTSISPHYNDDAVWGIGIDNVLPDNGSGTANLPPVGLQYTTPDDDMAIVAGLPLNSTIEIDAVHKDFVCSQQSNICSFQPDADCRQPGGPLGGEEECFQSQLLMPMVGTGSLDGFIRTKTLPVNFEVHTAPRMLGSPIQSFDTDMFRLQGQLPIGDPDFDLLRVTGGSGFGLPSPGHTTLTRQPDGHWAVDSFFDITYRIDFIGAPGGLLAGKSGSTTGTIRFQTNVSWNELCYPQNHPMAGQSIDLAFEIDGDQPCEELLDFGDAPDSYKTLLASDGARHGQSIYYMGPAIDIEADGQPTVAANGDDINGAPDDEDGVTFATPLIPGNTATVIVNSSWGGTYVQAWLDLNGDGDWDDAGEWIIPLSLPLAPGPNPITFFVPATATGGIRTYARFRLHSTPWTYSYTGYVPDGEVEDYRVPIYKKVNKGAAKKEPLGTYVLIEKNVVTANFAQPGQPNSTLCWYFEEPDRGPNVPAERGRSAGLGVIPVTGTASPSVGQTVTAFGYTVLNGCELMLQQEGWYPDSESLAVDPMIQNNRDSGGGVFGNQPGMTNVVNLSPVPDTLAYGLNTVGSLVTIAGKLRFAEYVDYPWGRDTNFWIDDGSNLADGDISATPPIRGVKVHMPLGYNAAGNNYFVITGIMRTANSRAQGECIRWLWTRDNSDVQAFTMIPPAP